MIRAKRAILSILLITTFSSAKNDYQQKALSALEKITTSQIEKIQLTANSTSSKNEKNIKGFVLSTQIRSFSDIPKNIDMEIKSIKKDTRFLIRQIALDIEMNDGNSSGALSLDERGNVKYTPNKNLPDDLNKKREELLEANLKNNVSIRSAYLALSLLGSMNNEIIAKAKEAKGRKEKEKLYMKQAVYVYEISGIVLSLLDNLTLDGKNSIEKLHNEAKTRVATNIENLEKQKQKAKRLETKGLISDEALTKELNGLQLMEKANERSLDAWKGILTRIGSQEKYLEKLKQKRDLIEYKQSKAKIQIETLRDLRSVASLKDSIGAIDDLVGAVDQLDLLVLDDKAVTALLGGNEE